MRLYAAVLVLMLAAPACGTAETQRPSLEIQDTVRDVGRVIQGETIRQIFEFTNRGSATLEILDVAHS